jgi:hypothetical protein
MRGTGISGYIFTHFAYHTVFAIGGLLLWAQVRSVFIIGWLIGHG